MESEKLEEDIIWYEFEEFAKIYKELGVEGTSLTNFLLWKILIQLKGK